MKEKEVENVSVEVSESGPEGYENWRRQAAGVALVATTETPLYSDSHVTGEVMSDWGPYRVMNTIAAIHGGGCLPVLVLRSDVHASQEQLSVSSMNETNLSGFHGGNVEDELSALIGLSLGMRLRPSSKTRETCGSPLMERPRAEAPASKPCLLPADRNGRRIIETPTTVKITADALVGYRDLKPSIATTLVRAARLYQAGLWIADSNPSDAWLMFVSAVEVAAVAWRSERTGDPETLLRQLRGNWVKRLEKTGDQTVVKDMSKWLVKLLGATDRFIDFILEHKPDPPDARPNLYQIDWSKEALPSTLNTVYSHRSDALHGGIPFPVPMCEIPWRESSWAAPAERPIGLATAAKGGVWQNDKYPIHLHVFAYIVRRSLLNRANASKTTYII